VCDYYLRTNKEEEEGGGGILGSPTAMVT